MAKPFEISYTPEQFDPATGGGMPGAYGGINVQQPENIMGPQYFPSLDDFNIRNQEIRSRPAFDASFIPAPDANVIQGIAPGFGPNAGLAGFHTLNLVAFTTGGVYRWDGSTWHLVTANGTNVGPLLVPFQPVSWRIFQNILYWTNGGNHTFSWDGLSDTDIQLDVINISSVGTFALTSVNGAGVYTGTVTGGAANAYAGVKFTITGFANAGNNLVEAVATASSATSLTFGVVTIAEAGPVNGQAVGIGITVGALFIDELDNHLLVGNTNENGIAFPWRMRWSANGLPTVWDPTVNVNAGLADFLEVTDQITGSIMLGRVGYIVRSNGITEIAPTGNGVAPFDFNHLWANQNGIGNILPQSVGVYGPLGIVVATDNIYQLQSSGFSAIGGVARDAIYMDIGTQAATDGTNGPAVIGFITPYLVGPSAISAIPNAGSFVPFPFLTYMLFIRVNDSDTRVWIYSIEDRSWIRWTLPDFWITAQPCITLPGTVAGNSMMLFPWRSEHGIGGVFRGIGAFTTGSFNDTLKGSSYSYRVEDVEINRYPTVRRVILTYRDLGQATITVTLTGNNDNGQIVSNSVTTSIGNVIATNALVTKFVDITLSAFRPQLSISRAANGGPVSITRATLIGTSEEVTL